MKTLKRDHIKIWYAIATGETEKQKDKFGNYTGHQVPVYSAPVEYDKLSAQNRQGIVHVAKFGLADDYVDSYVTDDMSCPIKADSRLWIDAPAYVDGVLQPHTHMVRGVIPTKHVVRILAKQVSVS